jgi:putative DNA primase/helicase
VYTIGAAKILFLSAVARVRKPGCKVDTIVILEGPQGTLKSTLLSTLAAPWFADTR